MYEYLDDHIDNVKQNIKAYVHNSRLGLLKYDELNVNRIDSEVDGMFDKVDKLATRLIDGEIKSLARKYGFDSKEYTTKQIFSIYNPTTLYVYLHEIQRKKERYKEQILSSLLGSEGEFNVDNKTRLKFPKKIMTLALLTANFINATKALANSINRQIEETAIEGERYIFTENGKKNDIKYVRWVSEHDEKVCTECEERDGVIYPINAIPPRPHHNCRCELEYVTDEEYEQGE